MTTDYRNLPGLAGVYLEDSYVTAINEATDLVFELDAVLTPAHPDYRQPRAGEQYCYAAATLTFQKPFEVEWIRRTMVRSVDADGLEDLGSIDRLTQSGNSYRLTGDWGEVVVHTRQPPSFYVTSAPKRPPNLR
ncbi:hypothetical protein ACNHUS_18685 [Actinomycetes bacterium M1A6_2h]